MKNPALTEQPDHAHYMPCRTRKNEIEKLSKKIFVFTLAETASLFAMFLFGIWLSVFSWLPSLCGDDFTISNIFMYLTEFILMIILAFAGCFKYKICHVIIFAVNCLIILGCLTGGFVTLNTLPLAIGVTGVIFTYPAISACTDYSQLMQTEGFPTFSNIVSDADDNPEFISDYSEQYRRQNENTVMSGAEKPVENLKKSSPEKPVFMDDIPEINISSGNNQQ